MSHNDEIIIEFQGTDYTLTKISAMTGVSRSNLYNRYINGETPEELLRSKNKYLWEKKIKSFAGCVFTWKGEKKTFKEWSELKDIPLSVLNERYRGKQITNGYELFKEDEENEKVEAMLENMFGGKQKCVFCFEYEPVHDPFCKRPK